MEKFRILSLDGGGAWAVIQAGCLGDLYGKDTPGRKILSHFNLTIANSGGSLILAGLALNLTPQKILQMLSQFQNRRKVFKPIPVWGKLGIGPRYQAEAKREGLRELLWEASGENPELYLSQVSCQIKKEYNLVSNLVICAYDYDLERASFFRSDTSSQSSSSHSAPGSFLKGTRDEPPGDEITLLDANHSASHAPVLYFEKTAEVQVLLSSGQKAGRRYWDGAVGGNNNPALSGLTEAVANEVSLDNIQILSVGTGQVRRPSARDFPKQAIENPELFEPYEKSAFQQNLMKMATSIISDPPDAASFIAYHMLQSVNKNKSTPAVVRLNPLIAPVWDDLHQYWHLPDGYRDIPAEFSKIIQVDMDAVSEDDFSAVQMVMQFWLQDVIPNQAIQFTRYLKPVIGQGRYSEGKNLWQTLCGRNANPGGGRNV